MKRPGDLTETIGHAGDIEVVAMVWSRQGADERWTVVRLVDDDRWIEVGWGAAANLADLLEMAADAIANDETFHHTNDDFAIYADAENCKIRVVDSGEKRFDELRVPPEDVAVLAKLVDQAYLFVQTIDDIDTRDDS